MADDPGKSYRDKLNAAADKALEVYNRNKRYKPSRETDKYILDRMLENIPGMRPDPEPKEVYTLADLGYRPDGTPMTAAEEGAFRSYTDNTNDMFNTISSVKKRLEGLKALEKDLDIIHGPDNQTYHTDRKAWDEAADRLKNMNSWLSVGRRVHQLTAADKQRIQDLQNELAELYTAPGAQEDRPGRLQEIKEALDLTNPDSGGRAFLRELKRKMIDDKVPRIQAGHKTQTGEEFMLSKIKELGVSDTPATRGAILAKLGMNKLPEKMPLLDDAGNPVPLYVDEMKAAREAAADKAYMQHRRDPMKDTPERD